MSELKNQELPPLDVTDEERQRAALLSGVERWTRKQLEDGYREAMTWAYCRSRQLLAALNELKHYETQPFHTRNLFAGDGELAHKDWSQVTEDDFRRLFEYSDTCKCQGCSEVRYILSLRNELKAKDTELAAKEARIAELEQKYESAMWEWMEDLGTANKAMGTKHRNRSTWENVRAEAAEAKLGAVSEVLKEKPTTRYHVCATKDIDYYLDEEVDEYFARLRSIVEGK